MSFINCYQNLTSLLFPQNFKEKKKIDFHEGKKTFT